MSPRVPAQSTAVIYARVNGDLHKAIYKYSQDHNVPITTIADRALRYYLNEKCGMHLAEPVNIP